MQAFTSSLGPKPSGERLGGWSTARAPNLGRLLSIAGGALEIGGAFILLFLFARLANETAESLFLFSYLIMGAGVIILPPVGAIIRRFGKQLQQPTASERLLNDKRAPVVLLRSFGDDDLRVVRSEARDKAEKEDFEVSIEDQFAVFGPMVAIGRPGETLPALGAARNYYNDAEWKEAVVKWMDAALMLVVIPGMTAGLGWELETIRDHGHLNKLLVLMPPRIKRKRDMGFGNTRSALSFLLSYRLKRNETFAGDENADRRRRWQRLRAGIDIFQDAPEFEPDGLMAMHLTSDDDLVLLIGPTIAWESEYERAIRTAVYGMFCQHKAKGAQAPAQLPKSETERLS